MSVVGKEPGPAKAVVQYGVARGWRGPLDSGWEPAAAPTVGQHWPHPLLS